jgi:trans-L-3-hydroxyproline dehydratase
MTFDRMLTTVETHAAGEPFRIVTNGLPRLHGTSIVQRRAWAAEHCDTIRTALMLEPRGHADMYGGYLTGPISDNADLGIIFLHNEGYSDHCGHGTIALATAAVQLGWVTRTVPETRVGIDAPCGFIEAFVAWDGARARSVRFINVPSYVERAGITVQTRSFGAVTGDIAFGGAFYVYVEGAAYGLKITPNAVDTLIKFGAEVKQAAKAAFSVVHPRIPELNHIYGTIVSGPPATPGGTQANCCIFADRQVDRSPTGSGTAGRVALLHANGRLAPREVMVNESIIGTTMTGRVIETLRFEGRDAVIPEISGTAHITGFAQWCLDPDDPVGSGFLVR